MTCLYNLKENYQLLLEKLYDDEFSEEALLDTLESLEEEIEDKADSYAIIINELQGDIDKLKKEEDRLKSRRKALESRVDWLKGNLFNAMVETGKKKFKTALFSFGIQKNGGKRGLVLNIPVDKLPAELQKVTIEANNEALRESLGEAESNKYCYLLPQGESLRIR